MTNSDLPLGRGLGSLHDGREFAENDFGRRSDDGLEAVLDGTGDRVRLSDTTRPGLGGGDTDGGMLTKLSDCEGGNVPVTWRMKVAIARKQYFAGVVKENNIGRICAASSRTEYVSLHSPDYLQTSYHRRFADELAWDRGDLLYPSAQDIFPVILV